MMNTLTFNLTNEQKREIFNEVLFNDTINNARKEILFMIENNLQDIEKLKKLDDKDFRIITNIFLKRNNENVTQKETMIYAIHEYLDNITI